MIVTFHIEYRTNWEKRRISGSVPELGKKFPSTVALTDGIYWTAMKYPFNCRQRRDDHQLSAIR